MEKSPGIKSLSWGRLEVEGGLVFRDGRLFPGGAREWDWKETGTSHDAGIQPADVADLLAKGATEVVLGTGVFGRLRVAPETLRLLEEKGVLAHAHRTKRAVEVYNELRTTRAVAGLFHTTC